MSAFKKIVATTALTLAASTASAALIQVQDQTQTHAFDFTTWTDTFTFNLYDASLVNGALYANGGALERVELSLNGASTSTLTFTAGTDVFVSGTAGSAIFANVSLGGGSLDIDVSPNGAYGTSGPGAFVPAGVSTVLGPLTGSDTASVATTAAADLMAFSAPGTFDVGLLGLGSLTLSSLGGNATAGQVTQSTGTFSVAYFFDDTAAVIVPPTSVPVPGTLALLGLGLLAMRARKSV